MGGCNCENFMLLQFTYQQHLSVDVTQYFYESFAAKRSSQN